MALLFRPELGIWAQADKSRIDEWLSKRGVEVEKTQKTTHAVARTWEVHELEMLILYESLDLPMTHLQKDLVTMGYRERSMHSLFSKRAIMRKKALRLNRELTAQDLLR